MKTTRILHPEYFILPAVFILLIILSFLSEGYYGGADNINHYFISRYAFDYPKLFLNPWGRPLYTILSSPFAQLGFGGIKVFNVILGVSSAWLLMKTAEKLKVNPSWMSLIILCFTPLYMVMLFTAMTEILFGFVFILSLYLFFSKRFIASAIVISFLPFARSEGYLMIPILGLALLIERQWKAIPFLALGFVVISLLGVYQYGELLWVITQNPYPLIHPVYHQPGDFWVFIEKADITFGAPGLGMLVIGIIMLLAALWSANKEKRKNAAYIILLFLVPVLVYYFFHSFMFYKGWAGSLGFIRVMAGMIPLTSLIVLYGFSLFTMIAGSRKWLRVLFIVLFLGSMIVFNFTTYRFPFPPENEEKLAKTSALWVRDNFKPLPLVLYNDFNMPYYLGTDPYNLAICRQIWPTSQIKDIPPNVVYIWDAHFGPNECKMPLDSIMQHTKLRLVKIFRPEKMFTTLGDLPYEIRVFVSDRKTSDPDNYILLQGLIDESDKPLKSVFHHVYDFESERADVDAARITSSNAASGKRSFLMNGKTEFSPGLLFACSSLPYLDEGIKVKARVKLYSELPYTSNPSALVISLENKKGAYFYQGVFLVKESRFVNGAWMQVFINAELPKIRSKNDFIKIYIWHQGKGDLLIDDLVMDIVAKDKDSIQNKK